MPKISVITINLNNCNGLIKTIESVVEQNYDDYEYLIIDGGSNDGSIETIRNREVKISYWISEPDHGIFNAMNKGILKAQGEYLLFLNSGDTLADINVLNNLFNFEPIEDIVYGDLILSENGMTHLHKFPNKVDYEYFFYETLGHPSTLIKRELFKIVGLYDENLKVISDWAFFLKAIVIHKASYRHVDMPVSVFMLDGASSLPVNSERKRIEREKVLVSLFPRFNIDFHHYPHLFNSRIASFYNFFTGTRICHYIIVKLVKVLVFFKGIIQTFWSFNKML